ncbi:hypothetical protein JCM8547_006685 [Rhodosporidiobolus lusitaniae]
MLRTSLSSFSRLLKPTPSSPSLSRAFAPSPSLGQPFHPIVRDAPLLEHPDCSWMYCGWKRPRCRYLSREFVNSADLSQFGPATEALREWAHKNGNTPVEAEYWKDEDRSITCVIRVLRPRNLWAENDGGAFLWAEGEETSRNKAIERAAEKMLVLVPDIQKTARQIVKESVYELLPKGTH